MSSSTSGLVEEEEVGIEITLEVLDRTRLN